jgi:hypothetical protein
MTKIIKKPISELPKDIQHIINALKISKHEIEINGSQSIKNIKYPNDYDLFQKTTFTKKTVENFQNVIKRLIDFPDLYISDIKVGSIKSVQIIPNDATYKNGKIINYDYEKLKKHLKKLHFIYDTEQNELIKKPSVLDLFKMKKIFNKHILRWTPDDVLRGYINFYGSEIYLEDALKSRSRCKIDFIVLLNNIYTEFSIIYEFPYTEKQNRKEQLMNDIFMLYHEGNYYKMSKRIFSFLPNSDVLKKDLLDIFNSDLGFMHHIIHDLNIVLHILENENNIQYFDIKKEMLILNNKISKSQIKNKSLILGVFQKIRKLQPESTNKKDFIKSIQEIIQVLEDSLQNLTQKELHRLNLLPLPAYLSVS